MMKILLISDIHANFPALAAVEDFFPFSFDAIINAGDSTVYGPFPNETLDWLKAHNAHSILGNTDSKVIHHLEGLSFKKPSKHEKRIMYTWTADQLDINNRTYLSSFPTSLLLDLTVDQHSSSKSIPSIGVYHGSPADHNEFLFPDTPVERFVELGRRANAEIIVTGHSHIPFHRTIGITHFINPGSVGRMFDGDPRASCAVLSTSRNTLQIEHFRIPYPILDVVDGLSRHNLPEIYAQMFLTGRKLN
jgi:putative phosphoesterase